MYRTAHCIAIVCEALGVNRDCGLDFLESHGAQALPFQFNEPTAPYFVPEVRFEEAKRHRKSLILSSPRIPFLAPGIGVSLVRNGQVGFRPS